MVKNKNVLSRIYILVFYIRRIIFLSYCFFAPNILTSTVLIFVCIGNLIYLIYIGSAKPLENRNLNKLEIFNELFVATSTYFVMIFSEWVRSKS
jgi:hypothetical protein